ncbi:PREDICTED: phosphoserine aminotransferase-like [Priapulus caudatus]|uniref:Phosphoserine aminotransferase n=1 Tax=Priapulus caudatus TaxID=37621 RepID=A0ABM1F0X9_PRICU|nr:PREDICTED: phosphoserine aminotransferase-like [Priapulus caudatus]
MNGSGVINFSAGPSKLPEKVMEKANSELLNYRGTGHSVLEMSHRSAEFSQIIHEAESTLRELVGIPANYHVLFLQGGGSGQFSAIPLNLLQPGKTADYIVTGTWSAKAAKEAEKYGKVHRVIADVEKHVGVPCTTKWTTNPDAAYLHYCDNETIHGIEFPFVPESDGPPIVCDMSSNFLSRPIDVTKFGLIYAGAQKNIGCAGVTVVIVRDDLVGHALKECPTILNYKEQAACNSLYNTPPSYSIYIMGLVLQWVKEQGGVAAMERKSAAKSELIYDTIRRSNGFYVCPIEDKFQSRMNITFRIGSGKCTDELEKRFVQEAGKVGMKQLKGHRSIGGIRVSCYNAIHLEEVQVLVNFMQAFQRENTHLFHEC